MCTGGGSNRSQQAQQQEQSRIQQEQFSEQQAFSEQQFAFTQEQYHRAQEAESQKEFRIRDAVGQVSKAFGNREPIYKRLEDSTFNLNKDRLDVSKDNEGRDLSFALARSGRRFDSLDIDKSAELTGRYNNSLQDARTFASSAAAQARSQDDSLRSSLLQSALSGSVNGQELIKAASGSLRANAQTPASVAPQFQTDTYFDDVSSSIGRLANTFGAQAGYQQGGQQFNSNFGNNSNYSGNVSTRGL